MGAGWPGEGLEGAGGSRVAERKVGRGVAVRAIWQASEVLSGPLCGRTRVGAGGKSPEWTRGQEWVAKSAKPVPTQELAVSR